MSAKIITLAFILIIYVLILAAFNKARKMYSGGKVGQMINMILVTVGLLFVADYLQMFETLLPEQMLFSIQALFRAAGLAFLAYGGTRITSG